jgi:hypothetical protein
MNVNRSKTRKTLAGVALVATVLAWPGAARAESVRSAAAQRLFDDARELMSESRFVEACPKLAESQRLDPGSGTLLNLAVCHEQQGKTASAWLEYHQALASWLRENNSERRQLAEGAIAAIEPMLSRIRLEPPTPAPLGLWISIDDQLLGAEAWTLDLPVDPGPHRVAYGASGHVAAALSVDVVASGQVVKVPLPALRPAVAAVERPVLDTRAGPDVRNERGLERRWLLTGATLGIAATAFASMTYFGISAKNAWAERERHCASGCDARAVEAGRSAHDFARAANLSFGVGAVGLGLGSYLFFSALADSKSSTVGVTASVTPGQASLSLQGKL